MKKYIARLFTRESYVYVAIGDSATEGMGSSVPDRSFAGVVADYLRQHKKRLAYHNLGKSGAPTRDILTNQLDRAIALNPDLVTISAGVNDIRAFSTPWRFKKDLQMLIDRLQRETNAEIVLNNIPDFSITPRVPRCLKGISRFAIRRFNVIIQDVVTNSKVILVDLFNMSSLFGKKYPEIIAQDRFHPSDFGYALWANTIITCLTLKQNKK